MALRDDPARLDIANYPMRYTSRVLFADMDGFRHLNNVAIARFFEEAPRHVHDRGVRRGLHA